MADREPTFEELQDELERIVERLERGDVGLDELTALWERGEELHRRLAERLAGTQGRIEELARRLHDQPGPDQAGADQPGADQPGADQPGADPPDRGE